MQELFYNLPWIKMVLQLLLALILGGVLGLGRSYLGKSAGTRTFALISFGSCLFTILSLNAFTKFTYGASSFDPSRIASQIVAGIGFISMAVVIHRGSDIQGITTAVSIWVSAAIGMAVGVKFYALALSATLIALLVLEVLRVINIDERLENLRIKRQKHHDK